MVHELMVRCYATPDPDGTSERLPRRPLRYSPMHCQRFGFANRESREPWRYPGGSAGSSPGRLSKRNSPAKWRGLVAEQNQSGQSVAAFCSVRGLRNGQFFAWKKRLREAEAAKFVAVEVAPAPKASEVNTTHLAIRVQQRTMLSPQMPFKALRVSTISLAFRAISE